MATLPVATDFTGGGITEGQFKTALTSMRAFIAEQIGDDSATVSVRDVLSVAKTASYVLEIADRGKSIDTTAGVSVPTNASVAFPVGTTISITNTSGAPITITQVSGVTMRQAGTTATGNRTLSAYGVATLRKTATNTWFITGAGLS